MENTTLTKDDWILLTDGTNTFDSEVRAGALQLAKELGYSHIRLVNEDILVEKYLSSALLRSGKVGIISHVRIPALQKAIRRYRIPAVLLGEESVAEWRKALGRPVTVCSVDNRAIGQMAADYLHEQSRFASFVFAENETSESTGWWLKPRYEAFAETLEEHGFKRAVERITVMDLTPDVNRRMFLELIQDLPRPIAVFACNDRVARDVITFCESARILVPDDLAVLGVDNETDICESAPVDISSIKVEHMRLGRTAFRTLIHQLKGETPRDKVILCPPIRVIERASTRRTTVQDRFVAKAVDFIDSARLDILNAESVTRASGASHSYLSKRFRAETGRTILEAIHRRIMREVKRELLETDKTVAQIAVDAGFASASGLCTVFRRINGVSMSQYRTAKRP